MGEACGLGDGLSPMCAPGSYCAALDPDALGLVVGTCVAGLAPDAACNSEWEDLGIRSQCAIGYACIEGHCQEACYFSEEGGEGGF